MCLVYQHNLYWKQLSRLSHKGSLPIIRYGTMTWFSNEAWLTNVILFAFLKKVYLASQRYYYLKWTFVQNVTLRCSNNFLADLKTVYKINSEKCCSFCANAVKVFKVLGLCMIVYVTTQLDSKEEQLWLTW